MEQWEKDYRELLGKEIQPGMYEIGGPKFRGWTGKGGYIDYLVEIKRTVMGYKLPELTPDKPRSEVDEIAFQKLKATIEEFFYPTKK
jgi:hypothetical protein